LFGQFTPPNNPITSVPQRNYQDILKEYSLKTNKPSLANIDYGHIAKKLTLPFGVNISMNADNKEIVLLESPVCS
jgi:muramoyltetrapeptide carboxypeptidase LdcA involved in peptidoglycan recycling